MTAGLETLLAAAVQAPSGDNLQPWRFAVDLSAQRITLYVDSSRDPSPMNSGQLMSRVAVGAALENVLRTATFNRWGIRLEEALPPAVAVIALDTNAGSGAIEEVIFSRVTNRRFYDGRPLPPEVLDRLRQTTPSLEGVCTYWITEKSRLLALAGLIGQADALMFAETSMRRAFLGNVRFDAASAAPVQCGLPLTSLELSIVERFSLRLLPWLPGRLVKWMAKPAFAGRASRLVTSASGLCLGVAPNYAEPTYVTVGRSMQRAWLALSGEQLAVQPMMSLPVLDHVVHHGNSELIASLGSEKLTRLDREFRQLAPEIGSGRPAFLLRFGYAPAPSGRTGRMPWEASRWQSSTSHPLQSS